MKKSLSSFEALVSGLGPIKRTAVLCEPEATHEGQKQVGVPVPADLYCRLKTQAAMQGRSVQELVAEAITRFLA